jgi:hypothetical protein
MAATAVRPDRDRRRRAYRRPDLQETTMATAYVFDTDSMGESDYDALMAAMGLAELDAPHPDGLLAHLAGATPGGGWRVIDVWETDTAAESFYGSDQFAPVRDAAGGGVITTTTWPLHRVTTRAEFRELV